MTSTLVTGGAGFIGSHLVEALLKHGQHVRVLDNFSTGRASNLAHLSGVDVITGDVRDEALVNSLVREVDYVVHLAAVVSVPQSMSDPALTNAVNVDGTLNLLNAARQYGLKRLVLSSSCAVYGDNDDLPLTESSQTKPLSPYAATKLIGEVYCQTYQRAYGVPTVCLRYFNIYGPRQDPNGPYAAAIPKFIQRLKNQQSPIIYGDGKQTRDFVYVADVVRANLLACEQESAIGQVFNITTGRGVSLLELMEELSDLLGVQIQPEFQAERAGDIKHSRGDGSLIAQTLLFAPATTLREGLRNLLAAS
jgi:nucleoside-diphosphate-sugar epimerase